MIQKWTAGAKPCPEARYDQAVMSSYFELVGAFGRIGTRTKEALIFFSELNVTLQVVAIEF